MALKAILFDWFNTLARYDPPREELQSEALREFGVQVSATQLIPAILVADKYLFQEYAIARIDSRTPEEKAKVFTRYEEIMLTEAGIKFDKDLPETIYSKSKHLFGRGTVKFALFDDVLPVLRNLDEKGYVLGIITNFVRNMPTFVHNLGLDTYLDFIITPQDAAGAEKPDPAIFLAA